MDEEEEEEENEWGTEIPDFLPAERMTIAWEREGTCF